MSLCVQVQAYLSATASRYCCSAKLSSTTASSAATVVPITAGEVATGGAPSGGANACAVPLTAASSASSAQTA